MKKYIYKYLLGFSLAVLVLGCDDYLDINENPNFSTQPPITGLLVRTSFETGDNMQNVGNITSFYVQQLASPNPGGSADIMEAVEYDQTWFEIYEVMTDLQDLLILADELSAPNYTGVGKILYAINLGLAVDLWGDLPISQAFFAETLNPTYDGQEALYGKIHTLLDEGIAAIESTDEYEIEMGDDDFIYGGQLDLWVKAAHALKARYYNHLSKTNQYDATLILSEVSKGFDSYDESADVSYYDESRNPWASVAIANAGLVLGGWISEQLIETMDGTSYGVVDPRMPFMFGTTDDDEFVGTVNGAGRGAAAAEGERSTLVEGTYYSSRTSVVEIITYAELKFIEAEAAFRSSQPAVAYAAYLAGINSHMTALGVDAGEAATYLADPAVAVGANALTLELIMKEKYIALFLNPEAWVDARRFDYAYKDFTNPTSLNPDLNGQLIRRLIYPASETGRNGKNVPPVTLSQKLWWDQ